MSVCSPVAVGLTVLAVVLLMLNISLGVYRKLVLLLERCEVRFFLIPRWFFFFQQTDSFLKDTHLTPEDTEHIRNELKDLEDTYKAAFESTNDYKKQLDSELRGQTQNKWELEHQAKRSTNYEASVARIIKEIADLKYRIPKTGMSCLGFRSTHAFSLV